MNLFSAGEASELLERFERLPLATLLSQADQIRAEKFGNVITYSRKVFIPLTHLCRDTCGYCTFAKVPRQVGSAYLSPEQVVSIARAGAAAGCKEALFTLGDKPELRYAAAREFLKLHGFQTTVEYIEHVCRLVLEETGLLPHINAGVMTEEEIARLRKVSVSQGIMLESISHRLCEPGGAHYGSPDKEPAVRIAMIEAAGRQRIPFTSGILIGIGETRLERIESLLALRELQFSYGHIQEVIIQNFRAKPGTRFASKVEPGFEDLQWTAAVARLIFGRYMNIQVPPNLSYQQYPALLHAGINDWGGISPVTADHVNPEAPWPALASLADVTSAADLILQPRLAIYPEFVRDGAKWLDGALLAPVLAVVDSSGYAREDNWCPGGLEPIPRASISLNSDRQLSNIIADASAGKRLSEDQIDRLFSGRDGEVESICDAANELRRASSGEVVRYVVNRNINYTNVCYYHCTFCAFSKGRTHDHLRGKPYDLSLGEVARRAREAWDRGATEVCMQGGINPGYTGQTYLDLLRCVKSETPRMHVHAFSPLEISQGASTLGISVVKFLEMLKDAGLGSLPGTAAEILDDDVRAIICPDKLTSSQWLDVVRAAHQVGLHTTATIMFGHVESPRSWAKHLLSIRDLQEVTGGFTEFVPLPFVHMEAPMSLRGRARRGPTWREVRLMHAISRLVLNPLISNIQASWVKLGEGGVAALLECGVNDLGGTLMNESISRAAGTQHGQELAPENMEKLIGRCNRIPQQRTTLYASVSEERRSKSLSASDLTEVVLNPYVPPRKATKVVQQQSTRG